MIFGLGPIQLTTVMYLGQYVITLKTGNPLTDTLANSEDPEEMPHMAFHQEFALFAETKPIIREDVCYGIYNL